MKNIIINFKINGLANYDFFTEKYDNRVFVLIGIMKENGFIFCVENNKLLDGDVNYLITDQASVTESYVKGVITMFSNNNLVFEKKQLDHTKMEKAEMIVGLLLQIWKKHLKNNQEIIEFGGAPILLNWSKVRYGNLTNIKQVSGYIYNNVGQILIVKNGKNWTIQGGKPENDETFMQTLNREVMEETCVTIKNLEYIGEVLVSDLTTGEKYIQKRFKALIKEIFPFVQDFEVERRLFVPPKDIGKYIKWSKGKVFQLELCVSM